MNLEAIEDVKFTNSTCFKQVLIVLEADEPGLIVVVGVNLSSPQLFQGQMKKTTGNPGIFHGFFLRRNGFQERSLSRNRHFEKKKNSLKFIIQPSSCKSFHRFLHVFADGVSPMSPETETTLRLG